MRPLVCMLVFALGCSSFGDETCPASPHLGSCSTAGLTCSYPMGAHPEVCTCGGDTWSCSTCGDLGACSPGDSCYFSDWERDCDCGCTAHGHWQCKGFYQNYGCPTDSTYQDAGIDSTVDSN